MISRGYELLDLMILSSAGHVPPFVYEYIYCDGRIDVDRLVDAVAQVATIVPETLCRLDARHGRFKEANLTAKDAVSEVAGLIECGFEWDLEHGTQVKIHVGHGPDTDSMVIGISHILSDGMGLMQYTSLIADAYNGVLPQVRNHRSLAPILAAADIGPQTEAEKRSFDTPSMGLPLQGEGNQLFCHRVTFPEPTMAVLHGLTRSHGVTLNDVFFAACFRVATQVLGLPAVALRCPADTRPIVNSDPLTIANMTGIYRMVIDVGEGDPFSATLAKVHEEIIVQKQRRRNFYNFPDLAKIPRFYPVGMIVKGLERTYTVRPVEYTNCGIQPSLSFGAIGVNFSFMTGSYATYPEFPLAVSSFGSTTSLAVTLAGDENRSQAGEKVLHRVVQEIEDWMESETNPADEAQQ